MSEERLICVHGTYDVDDDDEGARWWQLRSGLNGWLRGKLPPNVTFPKAGELFRWSGENSERERRLGGLAFLKYIEELERRGLRYHVLAHSHGGNVVLEALREHCLKVERGRSPAPEGLPGLRSLITVGTPFMHYRRKPLLLAFPGLASAMMTLYVIGTMATIGALGLGLSGFVNDTPDCTLLSIPEMTRGRWLLLSALLPTGLGILTTIALALAGLTSEAQQVLRDERLTRSTIDRFGPRMRHLWSTLDEAIHGLSTTMETKLEVLPELKLGRTAYVADQLAFFSAPVKRLISGPFNGLIRPSVNKFVANQVRRALQGADRPFSKLGWVTPGPDRLVAPPPLPHDVDIELRRDADIAAMAIPPAIRQDLAKFAGNPTSVMKFLEGVSSEFSPKALIHTGYFHSDECREWLLRVWTDLVAPAR